MKTDYKSCVYTNTMHAELRVASSYEYENVHSRQLHLRSTVSLHRSENVPSMLLNTFEVSEKESTSFS